MNVFLIPVGIFQDIEGAISKFWWRSDKNKGIHWLSWDKLTNHKNHGGMGFRDLRDFNLALLAKQGCNPSYTWRSVFEAEELVRSGLRRIVGDGSNVSILAEPWLPDDVNPFIESLHPGLVGKTVDSLMKVGLVEWDEKVVTDVLNVRDQSLVWKIPLSSSSTSDMWYWLKDESSLFTLSSRHVPLDSTCPLCLAAPETALHILVRCPFAQSCWNIIKVPAVAPGAMLFSSCLELGLTHRNDLVWNSKQPVPSDVVTLAKLNYVDWFNAQQHNGIDVPVDDLHVQSVNHWTAPDLPYVKVNVDGAIFTTQGRYGVGLVVRTIAGLVLAVRVLPKSGSLQPHVVEAIGIKEALS
uniref:Reverse transcriptase zinc-binding domain-containing protein n=1 Tax=Cannabis sativa TaxID=3483 RepID=A0A803PVV6_CANSA